jgi:hypothetical protein
VTNNSLFVGSTAELQKLINSKWMMHQNRILEILY